MSSKATLSSALLSTLRRAATPQQQPFSPQCCRLRSLHTTFRQQRLRPRIPTNTSTPTRPARRTVANPADDPNWISLVDVPKQVVRTGRRHNKFGLAVLITIPVTAFALGTWQVQRLQWKNDLIARFEDRLVRPPLPLPPSIDPDVVKDFDYRRVYTWGRFRHDQEILVGPRVHDGAPGFQVITPLERDDEEGGGSKILVSRGWISKEAKDQAVRRKASAEALPEGRVKVQGLLREPFKKNLFTPDNLPEKDQWYFPDVGEMSKATGSTGVWMEETMSPDLMTAWNNEEKGIPIGRAAEVNLRNNHTQYIFTWYALSLATTIMFYMVVKKPATNVAGRVRASREWG